MVRVRVKNFQSIVDEEVIIDGLVVITGPNNSGKTAFMRAIRGLFTNAPCGPLLRRGAAFLSVEMEFEDSVILWEKGWERPDQKGKGINRYTVNGKVLSGVGRGVPPQVQELGIGGFPAGNVQVWPQIAEQFKGTLFLLNHSGATVAEALSDVERVGKLTSALRLSEKDRRSVSSELKIRRKDLKQAQESLLTFEGLPEALDKVSACVRAVSALSAKASRLEEAKSIHSRLRLSREEVEFFRTFDYSEPDSSRSLRLSKALQVAQPLYVRYLEAEALVNRLTGFSYSAPDEGKALPVREVLRTCRDFQKQLESLEARASSYKGFSGIPDLQGNEKKAQKSRDVLQGARSLSFRLEEAEALVTDCEAQLSSTHEDLLEAVAEVSVLLGDLGECPTCNTIYEGEEHKH